MQNQSKMFDILDSITPIIGKNVKNTFGSYGNYRPVRVTVSTSGLAWTRVCPRASGVGWSWLVKSLEDLLQNKLSSPLLSGQVQSMFIKACIFELNFLCDLAKSADT